MLCLDEAYGEFAPEGTMPPLDVSNPRVLRFRTFSKAHGMAGARIGYALGESSLIKAFDKIRNHFGVNRIAQAGALAALADHGHLAQASSKASPAPATVSPPSPATMALKPLPSAANFVAIDCGRDGNYARAVLKELINRDIFVACPAWRRSTAASASAPAPMPTSPHSPRFCPQR